MWYSFQRMRRLTAGLIVLLWLSSHTAAGQVPDGSGSGTLTFRSGVDLVTVSAVVRDQHGKVVTNLKRSDFYVVDGGAWRPIKEFRAEEAPVSVALLFDASGSMQLASKLDRARAIARSFLWTLQAGRDELAVYSFDTELHQVQPFEIYRQDAAFERSLVGIKPYGMTSLNDAIAATARDVAARPNAHRAVIVFTDGLDNNSRLTPAQVSGIASSIDVPVYIVAVMSPLDRPGAATAVKTAHPVPVGNLADLARWTGGRSFIASVPDESAAAVREMVAELRHQYLIAFEPGFRPGWHQLEVRTDDRRLQVRSRSGYFAGQARQVTLTQDDREH